MTEIHRPEMLEDVLEDALYITRLFIKKTQKVRKNLFKVESELDNTIPWETVDEKIQRLGEHLEVSDESLRSETAELQPMDSSRVDDDVIFYGIEGPEQPTAVRIFQR